MPADTQKLVDPARVVFANLPEAQELQIKVLLAAKVALADLAEPVAELAKLALPVDLAMTAQKAAMALHPTSPEQRSPVLLVLGLVQSKRMANRA